MAGTGVMEKSNKNSDKKSEGKGSLARTRSRCKNDIEMYVKETEF
jgi:hypothetical protein